MLQFVIYLHQSILFVFSYIQQIPSPGRRTDERVVCMSSFFYNKNPQYFNGLHVVLV